jgi:hypothetical protein
MPFVNFNGYKKLIYKKPFSRKHISFKFFVLITFHFPSEDNLDLFFFGDVSASNFCQKSWKTYVSDRLGASIFPREMNEK